MKIFKNTISIVAFVALCMLVQLAGAITFTQPITMDTPEGVTIGTTGTNIAIGYTANGVCYGTAVGYEANGYYYGAAVGYKANGEYNGTAIGPLANGYSDGTAVGRWANGNNLGAAVGIGANGSSTGAGIGRNANGSEYGAAVGRSANGYCFGAAIGSEANAHYVGAAVGRSANGNHAGTAVGDHAYGVTNGVAVGASANGATNGVAVGKHANGYLYGAAVGRSANGYYYGAAVGYKAKGDSCGAALGRGANAGGGSASNPRIAIGYHVNNDVGSSCRIRGTLYIDGTGDTDANIKWRQTFDTGSWSTKTFVIDHPLDPKNKVLRHACLEGPKVQNVYNGTVALDAKGEAVIALPDYFEALNKNPHYVFAPIGAAMPNLHVKQKVRNNTFVIAGGEPGAEVCWEVKGERNDIAVRENPLVVEERKAVPGLVYRR